MPRGTRELYLKAARRSRRVSGLSLRQSFGVGERYLRNIYIWASVKERVERRHAVSLEINTTIWTSVELDATKRGQELEKSTRTTIAR